ncbi:MAG: ribonuclease III domain-containing protein [Microcoleaceae cyanobacterium]
MPPSLQRRLQELRNAIGLPCFRRQELLEIALNHPENAQTQAESLEHVGLAYVGSEVLSVLVENYLETQCQAWSNPTLTVLKSDLISAANLANCLRLIWPDVTQYLGESYGWKHPFNQNKILAQVFEAIIGAVYLEFDREIERTQDWLVECFLKTAVQELLMETLFNPELNPGCTASQNSDWTKLSKIVNPFGSVFRLKLKPTLLA